MIKEVTTIYRCQFCSKEFHKKDDCFKHECEEHLHKEYTMQELIELIKNFYDKHDSLVPNDLDLLLNGDSPLVGKMVCIDDSGTPVSPALLVLKLANIIKNNLGNITIQIDDDIDYNMDGDRYTVVNKE